MKNPHAVLAVAGLVVALLFSSPGAVAQEGSSVNLAALNTSAVPNLVNFSGTLTDGNGRPLRGIAGVTFRLYRDSQGGAPLWMETQNVTPDKAGHYAVQLGSTSSAGLSAELFLRGEARWLGVQVAGEAEQPRVLLVAVPYAMKAADAETVGGMRPSAFVLAAPTGGQPAAANSVAGSSAAGPAAAPVNPAVTGVGIAGSIPLWDSASDLTSSAIVQTGSGSTARVGINTNPSTTLDVKGTSNFRGSATMPSAGLATASGGKSSYPFVFATSAYNSSSKVSVLENFRWQAEPVGNNSANPSGTLNLLFSSGTATPAETGLRIANNGRITFAAGQAFPGTGTVSSVGLSAPSSDFTVSGSPVTGSGNLALAWKVAPTSANTANAIVKRDGSGNFNATSISATNVNVSNVVNIPSSGNYGVLASSGAATATVILGQATSTTGNARGIQGQTASSDANAYGVYGVATSSSGSPIGVYGTAFSPNGFGVYGQIGDKSVTGGSVTAVFSAGVWGDAGNDAAADTAGVVGTADEAPAAFFKNTSGGTTVIAIAAGATGSPFAAANDVTGAQCYIDSQANFFCSGSKNAIVPISNGQRKVALSAIESPKNWFEDVGSDHLVGGAAVVNLDPDFIDTVNTAMEYNVFLTPYGDCKGLFVTNRTANSFEVHELGGGSSSISFGYRIMALRKKYENVRFADHTHDPDITGKSRPKF